MQPFIVSETYFRQANENEAHKLRKEQEINKME
jgi:hypothetical protein